MNKITQGFVVQTFDEETGKCTDQEFVAGDLCEWENGEGDIIDEPKNATYFPYHMAQPNQLESLDQGDEVTVLEIARVALDDESIRVQLDISDEYANELKDKLDVMTEEKTNG